MYYTVRYAHLKRSFKNIGESITRGELIGTMGSTGQSNVNHLHIDCVIGERNYLYHLSDIGYEKNFPLTPSIKQLNYFIDSELFGVRPLVTTFYYDPEYKILYNKDHPGYDLVPINRHETQDNFDIHWNRSARGEVLTTGYDPTGYGNYIQIGFEG